MPALAGVIGGNLGFVLAGLAMTAAAGGDLAVLWAVREVPGGNLVLDHPQKIGCELLKEASS